jgi:hypothetical protein
MAAEVLLRSLSPHLRSASARLERPTLQRLLWVIGALALSIAPHLPH